MKSIVTIPKEFNKMLPLYKEVTRKSVEEMTADLLRVAQQRAPVKEYTLEQSGDKKVSISGRGIIGEVSFNAKRGNYNYAIKMDTGQYKLGIASLKKSTRGVRSRFSKATMKVGTGYLTDSAIKCKQGYTEYLQKQLGSTSLKAGIK